MRKIITVLLVTMLSSLAFAQFHIIPNEQDEIKQWFQFSYSRSTNRGFEPEQNFWAVAYQFDYNPFDVFLGVQITKDEADLTLDSNWWLAQFDGHYGRMRLGLNLGYHVEWYDDISCEHDITFTPAELHYRTWKGFWVGLKTGFCRKEANVYVLDRLFGNWNFVLLLSLGKQFAERLEFSFDAGTRTLYDYPVFGTAFFVLGTAYTLPCGVRIGAETEVTMRDWMASTYYMDSVVFRLTGRIAF